MLYLADTLSLKEFEFSDLDEETRHEMALSTYVSQIKRDAGRYLSSAEDPSQRKFFKKTLKRYLRVFSEKFLRLGELEAMVEKILSREARQAGELRWLPVYLLVFYEMLGLVAVGFDGLEDVKGFMKLMWRLDMETVKFARSAKVEMEQRQYTALEFLV